MEYKKIIEKYFREDKTIEKLESVFKEVLEALICSYAIGGKLLICGNGGSSADADHIVGELMNCYEHSRPLPAETVNIFANILGEEGTHMGEKLQRALPAISLSAHTALITAISNDIGYDYIYAQQVIGYGRKGDILMALSTSGNSQNIINGCVAAKANGIKTIGITGVSGGRMKDYCDIIIEIPEKNTARIQERTIQLYHLLCRALELHFFVDPRP